MNICFAKTEGMKMNRHIKSLRSCGLLVGVATIFTVALGASAHTSLNSWPGMARICACTPPDPHGAVGPNGILQTVNTHISYYSKSGTVIWGPINLMNFWA